MVFQTLTGRTKLFYLCSGLFRRNA